MSETPATAGRGALEIRALPEEYGLEEQLRPRMLAEFIGQERLCENLEVFITAARQRGEALDHVLFYGPPGLGKTALAHILAREMGTPLKTSSGPVIDRAGDLAAILSNLEPGTVFFIDEIHRLSPTVEEFLYPAMEDFHIDLLLEQGPSARSIRFDLPRFTLVGATTRAGLLTSPLRARFGYAARLDYYPPGDLEQIAARSARVLGVQLDPDAAGEIARRARGTPRIANRLLRRVRDFTEVRDGASARITREAACFGLERLEVDEAGLDALDRSLIASLIEKFDGGPVGLETLAAAVGEDKSTLEDVVEPYLLQGGYLDRTPRGRVATRLACEHLGIAPRGPRPTPQRRLF